MPSDTISALIVAVALGLVFSVIKLRVGQTSPMLLAALCWSGGNVVGKLAGRIAPFALLVMAGLSVNGFGERML
ncbi:MAG: hypothetical protein WCC64_21530, partial [Aliidongia sp.]